MSSKEEQINMAKMLEKYEATLARLYKIYAKKLPEFEQFWNDIAVEEQTHAFMARTFRTMIEDDTLVFEPRSFKIHAIEENLKILNAHITFAESRSVTVKEAFTTAMELENMMIEKKIFEIYEGDADDLKRTLKTLLEDTKRHYEKIEEQVRNLRLKGERL